MLVYLLSGILMCLKTCWTKRSMLHLAPEFGINGPIISALGGGVDGHNPHSVKDNNNSYCCSEESPLCQVAPKGSVLFNTSSKMLTHLWMRTLRLKFSTGFIMCRPVPSWILGSPVWSSVMRQSTVIFGALQQSCANEECALGAIPWYHCTRQL